MKAGLRESEPLESEPPESGLISFGVIALESGIGPSVTDWFLGGLINTRHSTRH